MAEDDGRYRVTVTPPALRSLGKLPTKVNEALVAFIFGSLADNPRRRGKRLSRDLEGLWSARRDDYRVIYQVDQDARAVHVVEVAHRSAAYRPR